MNDTAGIGWHGSGKNGAVAGGSKEAVTIAYDVLRRGGNAADAAASMILALSVTDFRKYFCFGGEVPMLVFDSKRMVTEVLCGQGAASALATRERFASRPHAGEDGRDIGACAVPGVLDACLTALARFGTMTFTEVASPMLRLLE